MASRDRLWLRALLAVLALPGIVAVGIPLLLRPGSETSAFAPIGAVVLGVGLTIVGWCVRDFYVEGRGTLAPWAPPRHLVTRGLYAVSRNPMYLGVLCMVVGWALGLRSRALGAYAAALFLAFHLRIVLSEEPWLARTFGEAWRDYASRVPRWLGRRRGPVGVL